MAHNWFLTSVGTVDYYKDNGYTHHGPKCQTCGVRFCIVCNPEMMSTNCAQFQKK